MGITHNKSMHSVMALRVNRLNRLNLASRLTTVSPTLDWVGCIKVLCILTICSFLFACSTMPGLSTKPITQEPKPEQTEETLAENPYLKNMASFSEQVLADFQSGKELMLKKQWGPAQTHWENFIQQNPQASGGYLNLGITLVEQNALEEALDIFEQGISKNRDNLDLYNQSGQLLRRLGRFEEAKLRYQAGLAQWSQYAPLHLNLGILYELYLGQLDRGLYHYQQFQQYSEKPDKKVGKWIIDLERRLKQQKTAEK